MCVSLCLCLVSVRVLYYYVFHMHRALKNLCLHAENKVRVMRANGHKLVVSALKANPGHAGIVDEACQTLGNAHTHTHTHTRTHEV